MTPWYGYTSPLPKYQHQRLVALRQLTSRGIPCILWGEDALNYVHRVPTGLLDQQILVPDDLLQSASSVLQEGRRGGATGFPLGILLKRLHAPDDDPNALEPPPAYILLLPQSYFGLDVRSKERFESLVPPLDPSNADILVPKYHTFLEGLVAFNVNPPIPLAAPHVKQRVKYDIHIGYLLRYRAQYEVIDEYEAPPSKGLLPKERVILSELQTEEARWYIGMWMNGRAPGFREIREYNRQRA